MSNNKSVFTFRLSVLLSRMLRITLVSLFVLAAIPQAGTQVSENMDNRFAQRLSWTGGENAMRFEVIIQRDEGGQYRDQLRESTTSHFLYLSLPVGSYRCQVIPYDYLDHPGEASEWVNIKVILALYPELDSSVSRLVFSERESLYVLNLSGRNLSPDVEVYLRDSDGKSILPVMSQIETDGSNARLFFSQDQLATSEYELVISNPGGFEISGVANVDSRTEIAAYVPPVQPDPVPVVPVVQIEPEPVVQIQPEPRPVIEPTVITQTREPEPAIEPEASTSDFKPAMMMDIYATAAWMPTFPVYGELQPFIGETLSLAGAAMRLSFAPIHRNPFVPGLEYALSWNTFNTEYSGDIHALDFGFNLLWRMPLPDESMFLRFRAGAGFTMLLNNEQSMQSIHSTLGVSFLWHITGNFHFEAGVDYVHWFSDSYSGALRPWIGGGIRF